MSGFLWGNILPREKRDDNTNGNLYSDYYDTFTSDMETKITGSLEKLYEMETFDKLIYNSGRIQAKQITMKL